MNNRFGRFTIDERAIHSAEIGGYLNALVEAVFYGKFVVRAESLYAERKIEYTAQDVKGTDFEEVTLGCMYPMYDCIITEVRDDDGEVIAIIAEWEQL